MNGEQGVLGKILTHPHCYKTIGDNTLTGGMGKKLHYLHEKTMFKGSERRMREERGFCIDLTWVTVRGREEMRRELDRK